MTDEKRKRGKKKKSIFRAIFVPVILIMILQSTIFYCIAIYGGVEESLNQNASDILSERLINRKNEIETQFNNDWADLDACQSAINTLYTTYQTQVGQKPFVDNEPVQIRFLGDTVDSLIRTLRSNMVNGIFLILNDRAEQDRTGHEPTSKYGLCIRDMDQNSAYTDREDLLLERAPSALIEQVGCSLDSWWEARYTFADESEGSYFYAPLQAAWENPNVKNDDLAYFSGAHRFADTAQSVVSYSIPLIDQDGYPYGVLGVELTTKYLASLLPSQELEESGAGCYILSVRNTDSDVCTPLVASGSLYTRNFNSMDAIGIENTTQWGGFRILGRTGTKLYGAMSEVEIYNNNNPFEKDQLVLMALVEEESLFAYSHSIKQTIFWVAMLSLTIGVMGIFLVSHRFAAPITSLAKRARNMQPEADVSLERLGISEIDQLVDSIEMLTNNVNKGIARTEFFSRMSHDMRTPMNAIIGFSSPALLEQADEAQKDDYMEKIHTSGNYLLGLINEVLDMTKIESNRVDLHRQSVSANRLWDTVLPMVEKLTGQKKLHFITEIAHRDNLYVLADQQHINQVVMNLLSNAIKFTPENGRVLLRVAWEQKEQIPDTIYLTVTVQDTGIGMSEEFKKKLFTPFEQENLHLGGTGLGLSISKKLVELMGGTIQCTSERNQGTTFIVSLPLQIDTYPRNRQTQESHPSDKVALSSLQGRHALLCEDQPLNAKIAEKMLQRVGITVDVVPNGQQGVERFSTMPKGTYDFILMDIRMPVLDGHGATTAIRGLDRADAKTIPIVAMTADAFEEDAEQSRVAGMNAHVSKPVDPDRLYQTLRRLISENQP